MSDPRPISLSVNGVQRSASVEPRKLLSDFIREDLQLTGTHIGCEQGVCGACTVLLDGEPLRSCLLFAVQADGVSIETVESMCIGSANLHPVQQAFWEHHGLQCGFCTPGLLLTAKAFVEQNPAPTEPEIREAISGNICRCTGYVFIVEAIQAAASTMREEAPGV